MEGPVHVECPGPIALLTRALRALATEGIQRGHMGLHARNVAIAAGAAGPAHLVAFAPLLLALALRRRRDRA